MSAPGAWTPQPEGLHAITQLLTEYRQPGADQAQARRAHMARSSHALTQARSRRFTRGWRSAAACPTSATTSRTCLARLWCAAAARRVRLSSPLTRPGCQDKPLEVRQSAGLLLKNNLRRWTELLPAVQAYVKARQSLHTARRAAPRSHAAPPNRSACSPASAFRSDTCASPWAPPSGARLGGTEALAARLP
jgi:hypothetical protein